MKKKIEKMKISEHKGTIFVLLFLTLQHNFLKYCFYII